MRLWGVRHAMQHPEIFAKWLRSCFKCKEYKFPSGRTILVQGYENFCLNMLLFERGVEEDDIIAGDMKLDSGERVPHIAYTNEEGRSAVYFPDIYIRSINCLIEVKSSWSWKMKLQRNILKLDASAAAGYNVGLFIFDGKGGLVYEESRRLPE